MTIPLRLMRGLRRLWAASPPLTAVGLAMAVAFVACSLGLVVDDRVITGSPAWLKPVKFAISTSVYCLTLAAIFAVVGRPSWVLRGAGWVIAVVLAVEVAIIDLQAARGTTSHFNVATAFDARLFAVMGVGIAGLLVASATVAIGLGRATFPDRAWGWAIKLGMVITVVGATTSGFMIRPTTAQRQEASVPGSMPVQGAHTVGARDGGPGLPLVGWSRDHGDLRVPHFFGLHAVQAVPILAWLAFRGLKPRSERMRVALVTLIALSYAALIALLTVQALAGRPVLALSVVNLTPFAVWAAVTVVGLVVVAARERSRVEFRSSLAVGA